MQTKTKIAARFTLEPVQPEQEWTGPDGKPRPVGWILWGPQVHPEMPRPMVSVGPRGTFEMMAQLLAQAKAAGGQLPEAPR